MDVGELKYVEKRFRKMFFTEDEILNTWWGKDTDQNTSLFVFTQSPRTWRTDGQTTYDGIGRAYA